MARGIRHGVANARAHQTSRTGCNVYGPLSDTYLGILKAHLCAIRECKKRRRYNIHTDRGEKRRYIALGSHI